MKGLILGGTLTMKAVASFENKHPGESMPSSPLRALSYSTAGSVGLTGVREDGPAASIMKFGYEPGALSIYKNKIVTVDEAHNLLKKSNADCDRLNSLLTCAENIVLVGFTATPIIDNPGDGTALMNIIRGSQLPVITSVECNSCPAYRRVIPHSIENGSILTDRVAMKHFVREITLRGPALVAYKYRKLSKGFGTEKLVTFCSTPVGKLFSAGYHRIMSAPEEYGPKLFAAAKTAVESKQKSIVIVSHSSYVIMLAIL